MVDFGASGAEGGQRHGDAGKRAAGEPSNAKTLPKCWFWHAFWILFARHGYTGNRFWDDLLERFLDG